LIASVRGKVVAREPALVVEMGGIGLALQVSARTAAQLPADGAEVFLHTHLHVREDHLSLYGFASEEERTLFLQLLGVNGVGPRVALMLLSSAPLESLQRALQDGDEAYLVKLPGVGKKTAARLVVELQGKMPVRSPVAVAAARLRPAPLVEEAMLALVSLGLTQRAAREAVERVEARGIGAESRVEDVVKAALQAGAARGA
jgi:Holliday junction DNA helicase RuvA